MNPFISICIPSYNRPEELVRLLSSVNTNCSDDLEIVISEDNSPRRDEIINAVTKFHNSSNLKIRLVLNEKNLGYDGNIRKLVDISSGDFIIFMGDDDIFDTENLPQFIKFIKEHNNLGYILKTHAFIHSDGSVELFKYYPNDTFFEPGVFSYQSLFRKSVFISGFCINRKYALPFQTEIFDGTLLYQLYLLAEVTLLHPSAYCSIPLTIQNENLRCVPLFGSSESEQKLYTPGKITVENSLNFMSGYINITNYIDRKHNIESTKFIKNNFSKYSYPVISIQRDKGRIVFMDYCKKLEELMHINQTFYYYIYYYSLLIFGRRICDKAIIIIKKLLGRTPNL